MSLCLLCPGQGSQTPDMLSRLAADPLAAPLLAAKSREVDAETLAVADDPSQCFLNHHAQPLIVLYGVVIAGALRETGIVPALVAGYSVGELTAHAVAGALTPATALQLARERAQCMDDAAPANCGMTAVRGVAIDKLTLHAQEAGAAVAIINGSDHAVVAGPRAALDALALRLDNLGAHVVPLAVSVPAHTRWMTDAVAPFAEALAAAVWRPHQAPVPSCIDGRTVANRADAINYLSRQIAEPLDWARTLTIAHEMGARVFFELGPGTSLTRMVQERFPQVTARALDDFATVHGAAKWLTRQLS